MTLTPAVKAELDILRERYPGKPELTRSELADYFGISEGKYISRKLRVEEIPYKKIGKSDIRVNAVDLAIWLAACKVGFNAMFIPPKRGRGFLKGMATR
jgi:hypothetical protein